MYSLLNFLISTNFLDDSFNFIYIKFLFFCQTFKFGFFLVWHHWLWSLNLLWQLNKILRRQLSFFFPLFLRKIIAIRIKTLRLILPISIVGVIFIQIYKVLPNCVFFVVFIWTECLKICLGICCLFLFYFRTNFNFLIWNTNKWFSVFTYYFSNVWKVPHFVCYFVCIGIVFNWIVLRNLFLFSFILLKI